MAVVVERPDPIVDDVPFIYGHHCIDLYSAPSGCYSDVLLA